MKEISLTRDPRLSFISLTRQALQVNATIYGSAFAFYLNSKNWSQFLQNH